MTLDQPASSLERGSDTTEKGLVRPTVAHFANRYYHVKNNWIHTQVKHHGKYQPVVLTWHTENLELGLAPEHYALMERPALQRFSNLLLQRFLGYYPSFYFFARRHRAQLIHAHFGPLGHSAVSLARLISVPLVTSFYGADASALPKKRPEWRSRYRDLFRFGARFLVEGPHLRQQLVNLGCPDHKITIQPLGIEMEAFPYQPRRLETGKPLRVLIAAGFTEKKGIIYGIEAIARLVEAGVPCQLTIIGDATPQSEEGFTTKRQILDAISASGIAGQITLKGLQPLSEPRKAYYQNDVLLAPSLEASTGDNEGGAPVALIEAAATGMTTVSTQHCDIPEIVHDGVTGLLSPERDSKSLANHLRFFVENPRQLSTMGEAARRHVESAYDARVLGKSLEAVYDLVVQPVCTPPTKYTGT